jgi:hypothetical protein
MWNSTLLKNSTLAGILQRQLQKREHGQRQQQQQHQSSISA